MFNLQSVTSLTSLHLQPYKLYQFDLGSGLLDGNAMWPRHGLLACHVCGPSPLLRCVDPLRELLQYPALRALNSMDVGVDLPEWVGGLTQLTELLVTAKQHIMKFTRCILQLHQLKELKLSMVELYMEFVQIAAWQHLTRIEAGLGDEFAVCYKNIGGSWRIVMLGESPSNEQRHSRLHFAAQNHASRFN